MALLSIKIDIHLSLSQGEATDSVLLNLSAAFDTIDHSTLLSCLLDWFSIGGSILKWFTSYLTEHYQSVNIDSRLSDLQKLLFGMPQGSVLGPLPYSIGFLCSFAQSSNWLPWCTSLFILVSLNILFHIYPHTPLLTILDRILVRVLPISICRKISTYNSQVHYTVWLQFCL